MTPWQINIAVHEAVTGKRPVELRAGYTCSPDEFFAGFGPNYAADLNAINNAMHEVVGESDDEWDTFYDHLLRVVPNPYRPATAEQLCETLLRYLNKWEEGQ